LELYFTWWVESHLPTFSHIGSHHSLRRRPSVVLLRAVEKSRWVTSTLEKLSS